ncbi:MAG TPA: cytochrome c3 family protein [Terriglobales bacterium]|nr:cytochrome c3 family protein [Terriglobales bacterium]
MKFRGSILAAIVVILSTVSWAGKHPVPLEAGAKDDTCLQCHEDKTKGTAVHTAMSMGCSSCHEVRVNKDITRMKLKAASPQALCVTCHADKKAADLNGTIHPPAVRGCIKCHDPHSSPNKNQLLKADSGEKGQNLCLDCHKQGENVPSGGSRHAALDMGCSTCHVTHKVGEKGKQEFDFHLTKSAPALCIDCHDPKDSALQKAHQDQPFGTANCTQCHDPHQSRLPKLMQAFTHNPFENKMCDTCHAPAKDGKVVLTQPDAKSLCVTCHAEQAEKIEKAKVQHPGAQGDCTSCHNAHAGRSPGFIQPNPVSACLTCHDAQAEQMKKKHLHQPAFEQGCATCHEPHGGDNLHLLRAADANTLCLECHGPEASPKRLPAEHLVTIFDGKVRLPENYFADVVRLPIKYGLGHPVDKHPVKSQADPTDATKARFEINCASCHQPHSSKEPGLLVNDQANNLLFCATCHKDLGK